MKAQFEFANQADLPTIVDIYNQSIPSRMATADLEPVTVASRQAWFDSFNHEERPIWKIILNDNIVGWVSLSYFYGRPAYIHTAEISIYIDSNAHHKGLGQQALDFAFSQLSSLQINTVMAFIFGHNLPSLKLFTKNGFAEWGHLPKIALMDGNQRDLKILGRHFDD